MQTENSYMEGFFQQIDDESFVLVQQETGLFALLASMRGSLEKLADMCVKGRPAGMFANAQQIAIYAAAIARKAAQMEEKGAEKR